MEPTDALTLLDWKRAVFELYAAVRSAEDPREAWKLWRSARDELFKSHPQSPLPVHARDDFTGLDYFDYDPALRLTAGVESAEPERYDIGTSGEGTFSFDRVGTVSFEVGGTTQTLECYWLEGYGGGLFLPLRDATAGGTTYGAGRYLYDTIKGADLGTIDDQVILDFNFAYNPSCSYDPRWVCPLAPPPNRLEVPIEAGERFRT